MLRQIALRGFKSFAGNTTLQLGRGLNVIVGPNGSGKSNLAEAIVWAMGEQRAGRLRASGMSDVVFSGGASRPAAGLAEVRLTLVDDEPGDIGRPAEVEVMRRVTRAGDASYGLNGASCRLLDVHEALAARGLGPDALAVIRQGQVEAVCTSRPSDIRAILEEAAGVALSRRRRRRAESRLDKVAERLDRARDLHTELEKRHATLDRQASAADRAHEIDGALEQARARVQRAVAYAAARAVRETGEAYDTAEAERFAQEREVGRLAAIAGGAERELHAHTQKLTLATARRQQVRAAAERLGDRADFAAARVREGEERASRRAEQAAHARQARIDMADARDRADRLLAEAQSEHAKALEAREAADDAEKAAVVALAEAREACDAADARMRQEIEGHEQMVARHRHALTTLSEATAAVARLDDASPDDDLDRLSRRAEIASARHVRWSERHEAACKEVRDAEAQTGALQERRRELNATLTRLARTPEGGLGSGVIVEAGKEEAVGAALGQLAGAAWADGLAPALDAVTAGAPCAVFRAPKRDNYLDAPGRPLIDVITDCPDEVRPFLEQVLDGCRLVDDITTVPSGTPGVYVSPDGRLVRPGAGVVTHGDGHWARGARRANLERELEPLEKKIADATGDLAAARDEQRRIAQRHRAAERAASRAERRLAQARGRAAAQSEARARATAHLNAATRDAAAAEKACAGSTVDPSHQDEITAARGRRDRAEMTLRAARQVSAKAAATSTDCESRVAAARVAQAEIAARDEALARASEVAEGPDMAPVRQAAAALRRCADALAQRVDAMTDATRAESIQTDVLTQKRDAARREVGQARSVLSELQDAAHAAAIARAAAAAQAEQVGAPDGEDPGDIDLDAHRQEIESLERRRRAIGTVNPLAAQERDELAERIAETTEQIDDLEQAAQAIRDHLGELDGAVTAGFEDVFRSVQGRFQEMISALFPGGEGRLAVVGDDEDPGVEIQVVPAGKRPRPLALLSGGERSLVALAFCLAIATARPAPFYLLDEVEAALDDTNLRRLLVVVRRLAEHTQFIMITHQQPTVEIADTLFGVTMAADGVSEVVARKLDRGLETARPFVRRRLTAVSGGRA